MPYLIITTGGKELHRKELKDAVVIGRSLSSDLWVSDSSLSRAHCRVECVDGRWLVVDLDSRNGTFVGGSPIRRRVLEDGDTIRIGEARAIFHADAFVPPRPSDPWAAQEEAHLRAASPQPTGDVPTWMPQPQPRTQPVRKAAATDESEETITPYGLAFQRAPAQPIVRAADENPSSPGSAASRKTGSWMSSLISSVGLSLRGRRTSDETRRAQG